MAPLFITATIAKTTRQCRSRRRLGLSALIVPAVYDDLKPLEEHEGRTVKVTGKLETYNDKTQIRVSRIAQIEVVEAATAD